MRKASHQGYGLVLIITFAMMILLTVVSMQIAGSSGLFAMDGAALSSVKGDHIARSALLEARNDIAMRLRDGTMDPATWSLSGTLSTPLDPTDLGSSLNPSATYTATLVSYYGNMYVIKVAAQVGRATIIRTQLFQILPMPASTPSFDCSVVENAVLAGNLNSVASADLIEWAQAGCMIKTATPPATPLPTASGSGVICNGTADTHSGSGTLGLNAANTCTLDVSGSYSSILVDTLNQTHLDLNFNGMQTVQIGNMINSLLDSSGLSTAKTFRLNSLSGNYTPPGPTVFPVVRIVGDCITASTTGNVTTFTYGNSTACAGINGYDGGTTCTVSSSPSPPAQGATVVCNAAEGDYFRVASNGSDGASYDTGAVSGSCVSVGYSGTGELQFTFSGCGSSVSGSIARCSPNSIPPPDGVMTCPSGVNQSTGSASVNLVFSGSSAGNSVVMNRPPATGSSYAFKGTDGADVLTMAGDCKGGRLFPRGGDDTIVIAGTFERDSKIDKSECTGTCTGNDKFFIKRVGGAGTGSQPTILSYAGNDQIYFEGLNGAAILGGMGNDIIACGNIFGGSCFEFLPSSGAGFGIYGDGSGTFTDETGNDIISIDAVMNTGELDAGPGNNIVYVNGISSGTLRGSQVSSIMGTTSGPALIVIGGNRTGGSIRANGTNNVLLLKTGTTTSAGVTISNGGTNGNTTVALTDAMTSTARFSRILWY